MITDKQLREENRYRDIGSGVSWKPLPGKILEVLFHSFFRERLLIKLGINDIEKISWNRSYGVGFINKSKQLRVLVSTREEISIMFEALRQVGSLLHIKPEEIRADTIIGAVQSSQDDLYNITKSQNSLDIITRSFSNIAIGIVHDYHTDQWSKFIRNHFLGNPKFYLYAHSSEGTGKDDIILYSIPLNQFKDTDINPSKPDNVTVAQANAQAKASTGRLATSRVALEGIGLIT